MHHRRSSDSLLQPVLVVFALVVMMLCYQVYKVSAGSSSVDTGSLRTAFDGIDSLKTDVRSLQLDVETLKGTVESLSSRGGGAQGDKGDALENFDTKQIVAPEEDTEPCARFPHLPPPEMVTQVVAALKKQCKNRRLGSFYGHYLCPESFAAELNLTLPVGNSDLWDDAREKAYVDRMRTRPTPRVKVGLMEWYGSDVEDLLLYLIFFAKRYGGRMHASSPAAVPAGAGESLAGGYFVEVGGNNGVHASNTLFYEKYLNWTGLLAEPTPCYMLMKENRPTAKNFWSGICETETTMDATSMLRFCRGVKPNSTTVRCAPMRSLIKEAELPRVDLMSIDVEGMEAQVLRSVNWEAVDVSVVLVEHLSHEKPAALVEKRSILEPKGFKSVGWVGWLILGCVDDCGVVRGRVWRRCSTDGGGRRCL